MSEIIDWFGKDIKFSDETEDEVTVRVMVNLEAMRKWALQYAVHVKILSPGKLVDMVKEDIKKASEQYKGNTNEKEIKELTECSTLEELFETWQAKQVEEVNKLSEAIHNSPEKYVLAKYL